MKEILILGGGTAGTIMANKLTRELDMKAWQISVVDQDNTHYYQPGFLFIPFGYYKPADVIKHRKSFLPKSVKYINAKIEEIQPNSNVVMLKNGTKLTYDFLIIATGCDIQPEETEGLLDGGWRSTIHDFYTFEGAKFLADKLRTWQKGKMVVNITEMPIKCPVAPLEFVFLADWYFTEMGVRKDVEIELVTPLPDAFTKPIAAKHLGEFLRNKNIHLTTEFNTGSIDGAKNQLVSWDEKRIDYDLLVTVPTNMGASVIGDSGLGDDLNFVPTDKHTLQAKGYENIFVIGDATDLPTSKAGSVAHFEADILTENLLGIIENKPHEAAFDGHANCFIETGFGKGVLIDFNYDIQPLPGKYPIAGIGPFSLLEETRMNHWGKVMFRWVYWNTLLKGVPLPFSPAFSMDGKYEAMSA